MTAKRLFGGGLGFGIGVLAYSALFERNNFGVRYETVDLLEPGADPIRVLHLSDIHLAPWQRNKIDWLKSLADAKPDLVIVTGDTLGHRDAFAGAAAALEPLAGVPGVFVHGSNDYFAPRMPNPFTYLFRPSKPDLDQERIDTSRLDEIYRGLGWVDLDNESATLQIKGTRITFTGTDDPHLGLDQPAKVSTTLDEVRAGKGGKSSLTIGVTHAPYRRVLNLFSTLGCGIIFAGHTHGGQVCLPGFGALTTNSDLPLRLARGLNVWNHLEHHPFINVSAGIGTSIFAPVRLACPPEAVVVDLRPGEVGYA